ncbi:MAG: class I tRNA ligase family protein, partial [Planctomycetota bacterium]
RFWHKVLFDLGHVSTPEPFQRLVNQGMILGETEYHFFEKPGGIAVSTKDVTDIREEATDQGVKLVATEKATGETIVGVPVPEVLIEKKGQAFVLKANADVRVDARAAKMSKSRGNVVNPDKIVEEYGADAFRLYEMYMGPLEAQKPWNTRDIIGMTRFLNGVWRTFVGDEDAGPPKTITGDAAPEDLDRALQRTIKKVGEDIEHLRFNTAIAELIKLLSETSKHDTLPRVVARDFVLLLSPFAPHLAEEIWQGPLGYETSVVLAEWPSFDEGKLVEATVEVPVQVMGKLRAKVQLAPDAPEDEAMRVAEAAVTSHLEGKTIRKRIYVPGRMVNLVAN